ncbi:Hypothetical_protein [Hexamita inflata]|uniref:Hypothetical_protein n=1 Tax=Hexamita inflata TaxID=28002 RepID=A0AA86UJI8_9EUKA|nr:Hypothetical protein HINF_LOCUS45824 [Hexamita inflata]
MAAVGTICTDQEICKSRACYVCEKAPNEKRCAITQLTCSATQMSVYVSTSSLTCKKIGGQSCLSTSDTTCAYGCLQRQYYQTFRCALFYQTCNNVQYNGAINSQGQPKCLKATFQVCSDQSECLQDCLIEIKSDTMQCTPTRGDCSASGSAKYVPMMLVDKVICRKVQGTSCSTNDECGQMCYPASGSTSERKCSSKLLNCSGLTGTTVAVNADNKTICALNDGKICPSQGVSLECLNQRCMQIEHDRTTLKCITLTSVSLCDACNKTNQVCVTDANNDGICRERNGFIGCDQNNCANLCLISRKNEMICTIPCESSCANPCFSENTGMKPICSKLPGETCDLTIEGQCEFSCLEVDTFSPLSSSRTYACSRELPTCKVTEVPIVLSAKVNEITFTISCVQNNGAVCTKDDECDSNFCYPVTKTNIKRCSDALQDCSADATQVSALKVIQDNLIISLEKLCINNTGEICATQGNNVDDCLSGICSQIKNAPSTLKCVSTTSIDTCIACDAKQICVADVNNDGTCFSINGETNCTTNSCANMCIPTKLNVPTCSVNCDIANDTFCQNSQSRCRAELTGTTPTCKSDPGELCSNPNPLCEFKCIQKKGSNDFKCSNQEPVCSNPKTVPRIVDDNGAINCEPNNGELCTTNQDCFNNICYPVAQSDQQRCVAATKNCGTGTQPSIVGITVECKKIAGQTCTNDQQGADSCFSGICVQVQGDPTVFKCITFQSVPTCKSCDLNTTKCAMNSSNDGVCLLINGQTIPNGTDCSLSCANLCIVSKLNVQTCSVKCNASCDQTKCRSDITGLLPTCFASAGEVCVPENNICVFECLEKLDVDSQRTNVFACSSAESDCSAIQVAVINTSGTMKCQPNDGSMCDVNTGCFSNICYPVVQSVDFKCSKTAIDCTTSIEPKISALDLTLTPVCIKEVGQPCQSNSDCFTNSCFYTDANLGEHKCAVKQTCEANEIPIYNDVATSECLKAGGQSCTLPDDGICAYGCFSYRPDDSTKCAGAYEPACDATHVGVIKNVDNLMKCYLVPDQDCTKQQEEICQFECMKDLGANWTLKCSNEVKICVSPQTPFISDQTKVVICKLDNHLECTTDSECASNTCYPVIQSIIKKCASAPIDCTSYPGMISALDLNLVPVCIKDAGEICSTEGVDVSCFSGICAQIRNDPLTLKCIPKESITTCQSCDLTKKCVNDPSTALCLQINGQINCQVDSCANMCIISRKKKMTCSLQCEATCDPLKCKSDKTGEKPSCKPLVSGGAIAGIVIGLWFLISLFVMMLCFIKRRKQKEQKDEAYAKNSRENQVQSGVLRIELAGIRE